jgi:hypothetical protein
LVAERLPGGLAARRKMNPTGEYRTRLSIEASVLAKLNGVLVEVLGDMGHGNSSRYSRRLAVPDGASSPCIPMDHFLVKMQTNLRTNITHIVDFTYHDKEVL